MESLKWLRKLESDCPSERAWTSWMVAVTAGGTFSDVVYTK